MGCQFYPFLHKWSLKPAISPCRASISRIQDPFFSYGRLAFLERLD